MGGILGHVRDAIKIFREAEAGQRFLALRNLNRRAARCGQAEQMTVTANFGPEVDAVAGPFEGLWDQVEIRSPDFSSVRHAPQAMR